MVATDGTMVAISQGSEASVSAEPSSLERMTRLRDLVRKDGMDAEAASKEVGVDPIIAQLWLRLPDDLWPVSPEESVVGRSSSKGSGFPAAAPRSGLRRVLTARIPKPAFDRLRLGDKPLVEGALGALQLGIGLALPEIAPGAWQFPRRPLAIPIPPVDFTAVNDLARKHFDNNLREAAGWLIARGLGMTLPLPTEDELKELPVLCAAAVISPPALRFVVPPRRRPEPRAPLPADDSAPNGGELRARREAVGISQRDLAAASGFSRGLICEIERGRRRHVLTRLRLAETLASLAKSSGKKLTAVFDDPPARPAVTAPVSRTGAGFPNFKQRRRAISSTLQPEQVARLAGLDSFTARQIEMGRCSEAGVVADYVAALERLEAGEAIPISVSRAPRAAVVVRIGLDVASSRSLEDRRRALGMSQAKLGFEAGGLSQTTVSCAERGKGISPQHLAQIKQALLKRETAALAQV